MNIQRVTRLSSSIYRLFNKQANVIFSDRTYSGEVSENPTSGSIFSAFSLKFSSCIRFKMRIISQPWSDISWFLNDALSSRNCVLNARFKILNNNPMDTT